VRRPLAWLLGAIGVAAAFALRALRRRRAEPAPAPVETDQAEELRRRLAESRAIVDEREEFEAGETPVDRAEPESGDPDERRRRVHEQGQAAIEHMRGSGDDAEA
jgi:hypothetical protein